ncbi:MAG: S4 domain-containing protein, partial [Pseudomonadota bacterium]
MADDTAQKDRIAKVIARAGRASRREAERMIAEGRVGLNGAPVTTDTVTITVAPGSEVPAGLTFDPATGSVSVEPGT